MKPKQPTPSAREHMIRAGLIKAGVKNLREFGYPSANEKNILTDLVYKKLFVSMLKDNRGMGFDKEVNALIEECGGDDV